MSLQSGINPLEAVREAGLAGARVSPGVLGRAGLPNTGGFDASDLLKKPERAQESTRDQAEKVSEPYREANMIAAEKTNPMNAESQNPGKQFLDYYIQGPIPYIKDPGTPLLIPKRK